MSARSALLISALFVSALAGPARAQDEPSTERARSLFQEGLGFADAGDWERAVMRFRAALDLRDTAPVRFNLAGSLARMGRLVEAIEELDRVLASPDADATVRGPAERLRAELAPRLGRLVARVRGSAEGLSVTIDGRPLAADRLGAAVSSDPGVRVARLVRGADELDVREVEVPEGGEASVWLEVPAPEPAEPAQAARDVTSEWWLWTLIGVLAVGAGAAIVTGVALAWPQGTSGDFSPPVLVFP